MSVDIGILSGILTAFSTFVSLIFAFYVLHKTNSRLNEFSGLAENIGQFLRYEENEEGEPMLDARLAKMVNAFSSSMAKSLKMSLLGSLSGPARLDKGLKGAIAQDVVENKMPMLSMIGDVLGFNTKKYVGKHPEAMMQLGGMLAPYLSKMKLGGLTPGSFGSRPNDGVGYGT